MPGVSGVKPTGMALPGVSSASKIAAARLERADQRSNRENAGGNGEGLAMINGTQMIASLGSEAVERSAKVARLVWRRPPPRGGYTFSRR